MKKVEWQIEGIVRVIYYELKLTTTKKLILIGKSMCYELEVRCSSGIVED